MSTTTLVPTSHSSPLEDRFSATDGTVYLTGIQALVRILVERARIDRRAGREPALFVSGYEGSPLAGLDLEIGRRAGLLAEHGVVHRPGVNEELAATAVVGTQLAGRIGTLRSPGVTGFWYGKAPGLDRSCDAFRHGNLVGCSPAGGAVALVGDDPGAKSSTAPTASERALADMSFPVFFPADTADVLAHARHAVELSRASGLWTAMKLTTTIADGSGTVPLAPDWRAPDLTGTGAYGHVPEGRLLGARLQELERDLYQKRLPLVLEYLRRSGLNRVSGDAHARIGIVAAGKTYLDLRQALDTLGVGRGVRLLKLDVLWPLEPGTLADFARGLDEIVVVEEKRSFVEAGIRDLLYGVAGAPAVHGKIDPDGRVLFGPTGELDPDRVAEGLARRLPEHGIAVRALPRQARRERIDLPLATRTPAFCSGCPHNSSTKVDPGTPVGAGIGCHTMVLLTNNPEMGKIASVAQMGGEGLHWMGAEPFVEEGHLVQNMGDGTFAHSGSLAIRAAVAAGSHITYKILYNSTVAMTGGQDAVGGLPVERLVRLLQTEGVTEVVVTSDQPKRLRRKLPRGVRVYDRSALLEVQRRLATVPGVTVLIHDQACAAENRRKRKRGRIPTPKTRVMINERVCEGCGDCGRKSNCLSVHPVETEFGRKTRIHQSSCNIDYSCLSGDCPAFVTVVAGSTARHGLPADPGDLPEPVRRFGTDHFSMRIAGVGGTGVVTVSQVLGTAAESDGLSVRGVDQTGLSQKGGAVVSDLKLSATPSASAARLATAECDLLLGADALVATDPAQLRALHAARTVAVVSTSRVPTSAMVTDPGVSYPDPDRILRLLDESCDEVRHLDAVAVSESLFGDAQFANMLLVGAAFQLGALPISAGAIEHAIRLNGAVVEKNLLAFRHGRAAVLAPAAAAPAPSSETIDDLLAVRVPDLVAYQNRRYADDYAAFVAQVRSIEAERLPGSTAITRAVARHLHKLMAYKDEYEVARLSLGPEFAADLEQQFGTGARYRHQLHPPVLRALGMRRKIGVRGGMMFRLLRAGRRLRGTALDPFGHTRVRRVERSLVAEYRDAVAAALTVLGAGNAALVQELAELPDQVRGYEDVKLGSVIRYRARAAEIRAELGIQR